MGARRRRAIAAVEEGLEAREARCSVCGCTDLRACDGGCSWVEVDRIAGDGLCSSCAT